MQGRAQIKVNKCFFEMGKQASRFGFLYDILNLKKKKFKNERMTLSTIQ